jgi:signal transduction histidine kinase
MIQSVIESGSRASRIVDNMLSFSRKSESKFIPHSLTTLLDRTIEIAENDYDLKKRYDFRRIRIVREYGEGVSEVPCEESKIQQVFLNLVKNAAEAIHEKHGGRHANSAGEEPRLHLRVIRDGEMVRVEIEDNGAGMRERTRRRVFEPFFTTKDVGFGIGLGLSVSYFIVTENHGGKMTVESTPGKGSKFVVSLPLERRS